MRYLLVLLISFSAVSVFANSEIKGAFGIELGGKITPPDRFDPLDPVMKVEPSTPYGLFSEYFIHFTPITHRVYKVGAWGFVHSDSQARHELSVLTELLEKKYWPNAPEHIREDKDKDYREYYVVELGQRKIDVLLTGLSAARGGGPRGKIIKIEYIDHALRVQSGEEALSEIHRKQKWDTSKVRNPNGL